MKKFKLGSRILSCVLVFAMILGTCTTAFAAGGAEPDKIKYVSLGDSMTNGYGLPGYDGNTGVEDYGNGSYANLFAEWLDEGYEGTVDHKQLAMSAMRAEDLHWLLELDYNDTAAIDITDADYDDGRWTDFGEAAWNEKFTTGDFWTWNELCDDYRLAVAAYAIQNEGNIGKITDDEAAIVAKYYQDAVKDADIISLGMGNGNFGVFAFGRIMEAIGFGVGDEDDSGDANDEKDAVAMQAMIYKVENAIRECDPAMQAKIWELKDTLLAKVAPLRATVGAAFSDTQWNALLNTAVYTGLSYVLNYAGSVEAILQLNPDAEIILVALMNTFVDQGATVDYTNIDSIGDIMGAIFEPLNMFIAALPTYMQVTGNGVYKDATFYYAEAPEVDCLVEVYGTEIKNPDSVIRERFVESIVGYCENDYHNHSNDSEPGYTPLASCNDWENGMVWGLLAPMVPGMTGGDLERITLDNIALYELMGDAQKAGYAADGHKDTAISCALYLAFEDAIVGAAEATVDLASVMNLGNLSGDIFGGVMAEFSANIDAAGDEYKETVIDLVEPLVTSGINTALGGVATIDADTVKALLAESVTAETVVERGMGIPAVHPAFATIVSGLNDGIATGKANVDALCMLIALPDTLSAALATDDTINGLLGLFARCIIGNGLGAHPSADGHEALSEALVKAYSEGYTAQDETIKNITAIISEYYDEAYAYAYAKADEKGYIDAAADAVDKAIKVISEIDADGIEMTEEFKANLEEELVSIVLTLEEIKTVLKEDKASDVDGLVQSVSALWDDLNTHLAGASALLDQAELDIKTLVVPVVDAYVSALISDLKDTTETELAKAVHKHYEADEDSYYVAIGGNTVLAQGTSKSYRKMIGEEYEITSKAVAKKGLYPSDILGFVADNQEEIAKADLITYQMDASSIVYATMFDTPDWDKYLDAETKALTDEILTQTKEILTTNRTEYANAKIGEIIPKVKEAVLAELPEEIPFAEEIFDAAIEFAVPYLQKAIDKAEEKRNEIGSKIEAIDEMAWDYAEKLAYAVVAFAVDTKAAIEEIQAINPGATLVVAGMYNPFNGFEIVVDGERVDIGEIFEYVIDAGNLYYTALAVENDNFAFVDISDAATNGFEDSISIETFDITEIIDEVKGTIFNAADSMHANADGHEYIKDQIVKALTCDYSVYEKLDKTYHTVKCSICDDAKKEKHSFSGKTCTLCGYVKESTGTGTVGGSGGGVVSNQFTVKFVTNGGSAVASVTVKKGELLAEPAAPTKEGFVFDGWYTDKALTAKYDFSTPVTKSFTLYANWAKEDALAKFNDIDKAAWYYEYVKTIVEKGLMNGVSETEFAPNATLTRGMFVTILHRVEGEAAAEGGVDFADVAADQYYANAVKWASVNGIVKGITETEFAPNAEVTREQMAAMIARYVEYKKIEVAVEGDVTYTDSEMISEYAKDAVKTANELGILIGNADGSFAPKKNATRAEAAALFVRLLGVLEK